MIDKSLELEEIKKAIHATYYELTSYVKGSSEVGIYKRKQESDQEIKKKNDIGREKRKKKTLLTKKVSFKKKR